MAAHNELYNFTGPEMASQILDNLKAKNPESHFALVRSPLPEYSGKFLISRRECGQHKEYVTKQ